MRLSQKTKPFTHLTKLCLTLSPSPSENAGSFYPRLYDQTIFEVALNKLNTQVTLSINYLQIFFQIAEMRTPSFKFSSFDVHYYFDSCGNHYRYLRSNTTEEEHTMFYYWVFAACDLGDTTIVGKPCIKKAKARIEDYRGQNLILEDVLIFYRPIEEDDTTFVLVFLPTDITTSKV